MSNRAINRGEKIDHLAMGYNVFMSANVDKIHTNLHNQRLGRWGEGLAEGYLVKKGYIVLGRNYRTPYGEIDLIVQDGSSLVFVEVKARTNLKFGFPESGITPRKRTNLLNAVNSYLLDRPEIVADWRVDVISISRLKDQQDPEVVHFENALG